MKRGVTVLLVLVNVLLAVLVAWLWVDSQGRLRAIHWQPPVAIKPELGGLSAASTRMEDADIGRFMAILDRPVFSPSRRPPPPPPPPKVVEPVRPDPLDTIHLYGLFNGSGGGAVIAQVEGKIRRIKVSEPVGDWNLKEIRARDVVFARGGQTRVVPLVQAKQGAAGTPAPRPAFSAPVWPGAAPVAPPSAAPPAGAQQPPGSAARPGGKPSNPFVFGGSQ